MLRETAEKKNSQNLIRDQVNERTTSYFLIHYIAVVVLLHKESACNAGDPGLVPGGEDPLEKGMATHSRILA